MNDFAARFGPWAVVTGASSVSRESRKRPPALYVLLFRVKRPTDPQPTPRVGLLDLRAQAEVPRALRSDTPPSAGAVSERL